MQWLIAGLCIVGFPALALRAERRGALATTTVAAVGFLVVLGLALASDRFGNRLAATQGYLATAARVLLMVGLTLGFPIVVAAMVVRLGSRAEWSAPAVYLVALLAAAASAVVGTILLFATLWG